jgi:hypothetical protein
VEGRLGREGLVGMLRLFRGRSKRKGKGRRKEGRDKREREESGNFLVLIIRCV